MLFWSSSSLAKAVKAVLGDCTEARLDVPPGLVRALGKLGIHAQVTAATNIAHALVAFGNTDYASLAASVATNGAVVVIAKGADVDHTRLALCAGLSDIRQQVTAGYVVTSGRTHRRQL